MGRSSWFAKVLHVSGRFLLPQKQPQFSFNNEISNQSRQSQISSPFFQRTNIVTQKKRRLQNRSTPKENAFAKKFRRRRPRPRKPLNPNTMDQTVIFREVSGKFLADWKKVRVNANFLNISRAAFPRNSCLSNF
jgi:hypothetical protein